MADRQCMYCSDQGNCLWCSPTFEPDRVHRSCGHRWSEHRIDREHLIGRSECPSADGISGDTRQPCANDEPTNDRSAFDAEFMARWHRYVVDGVGDLPDFDTLYGSAEAAYRAALDDALEIIHQMHTTTTPGEAEHRRP